MEGLPYGVPHVSVDLETSRGAVPPDALDTAAVLAEFRAARQAPRRRVLRRVATAVVGAFGLLALAVVAGHDLGAAGDELSTTSTPAPPVGSGPSAAVPSSGGAAGTGAGGSGSTAGGVAGGEPGTNSPAASSGSTPPGRTAPTPTTAAPPAPTEVAVVGPLLRVFAFGSRVGMPLLCSVAASALASQVPDPNVASVITTVVTSCIEFGSEGDVALRAMSEQLSALSAANPAVNPLVHALADAFNTAGSEDVPFAESLVALGTLVSFFAVDG